jgi:hypothetical protein
MRLLYFSIDRETERNYRLSVGSGREKRETVEREIVRDNLNCAKMWVRQPPTTEQYNTVAATNCVVIVRMAACGLH